MTEDDISSTHPLLPPTTEDDRVAWLRLLRSRRVGVTTFYRLLAEHGTAQAALEALPKIAQDAGVQGYEVCPPAVVAKELAAGRKAGARLICYAEADYPTYLTQIPDAPPILWMRGVCDVLHRPMVALVGARNASSLGLRMARRMAEGLSEAGVVVVSGLARGIDTAAHTVAVSRGTVAVLGGGVDVAYPRENADLLAQIAETDAVLSEQPMGVTPQARHFPARNRIIAGMSVATVVIEAAVKSGSLITARTALDQGRDVLAVPGHPFDARAGGGNVLIRDGARLVRGPEDVLEALPPLVAVDPAARAVTRDGTGDGAGAGTGANHLGSADPPPDQAALFASNHAPTGVLAGGEPMAAEVLRHAILNQLGPSPVAEDQLIRDLSAPVDAVAPALTLLELEGAIARQPGGTLVRVT